MLCVDVVGHSRKLDAEQIQQKERLNALLDGTLQAVSKDDRIILDTGDGAAIVFFGAPEQALTVALQIRDGLAEDNRAHERQTIKLRTGITVGPMRVVRDINGTFNVVGDGLGTAHQIMSFAAPGAIMVARSYYDMVVPEHPEIEQMFSYFGIKADKDAREYEMYVVQDAHKAGIDWAGMFASMTARRRHILQLGVLLLGLCLLALFLLMSSHTPAVPVEPSPTSLQSGAEALPAPVENTSKAPQAPVKRKLAVCTEAERMLNQCG